MQNPIKFEPQETALVRYTLIGEGIKKGVLFSKNVGLFLFSNIHYMLWP
jgi:hypothetical protein